MLRKLLFPKGIFLLFIFQSVFNPGFSQTTSSSSNNDYLAVYNAAKEQFGTDPLLMNGIYYENPYYNAKGHPFLGDGEFYQGSVVFRNKKYEEVNLKYDIYNQQLVIEQSRKDARKSVVFENVRYEGVSIGYDENQRIVIKQDVGKPRIMNLLSNEFVTEFSLDGMHFKKLSLGDKKAAFYQVISEESDVKCYYYWQKIRYKSQKEGDRTIFIFSDEKYKSYLLVNSELFRYRNNRSFLKPFTGADKNQIRAYIRSNKIKVNEAESLVIRELIDFCQQILNKENQIVTKD